MAQSLLAESCGDEAPVPRVIFMIKTRAQRGAASTRSSQLPGLLGERGAAAPAMPQQRCRRARLPSRRGSLGLCLCSPVCMRV